MEENKETEADKQAEALLKIQDDVANFIASMTGIKAQFVAAGWAPTTAEHMTVELYKNVVKAAEVS